MKEISFANRQLMKYAVLNDRVLLETALKTGLVDWQETIDEKGNTLLHWACEQQSYVLKTLLDHLPNPTLLEISNQSLSEIAQKPKGETVLAHWLKTGLENKKWFAQDPDYLKAGQYLVQAGAQIEKADLYHAAHIEASGFVVLTTSFLDMLDQVNGLEKWGDLTQNAQSNLSGSIDDKLQSRRRRFLGS